jgi:hypothetical protein
MAYERVTGPLDERLRADYQAGIIAATVANAQGAKLKAKDFVPVWFKRDKTPEEIWQEVLKTNSALGGDVRAYENS